VVTHRARQRDDGYGVFKLSVQHQVKISQSRKNSVSAPGGVVLRANSPGNWWLERGWATSGGTAVARITGQVAGGVKPSDFGETN
jgi:hypothetical protein